MMAKNYQNQKLGLEVMKTNELISIGIPTYNRPEGLKKALEMVTSQSYKNLEIIVSDNCSEQLDQIKQIINDFSQSESRITYYRQSENIGSLKNFQFLLNKASGEYFIWVADDDDIESNYIETLYNNFISKNNLAISMASYDVYDTMSVPHIRTNLSKYLVDLIEDDLYLRMHKYLSQSDHFGKSRLMWGLFKTSQIKEAFDLCIQFRSQNANNPIWAELPIEFAMLTQGNLVMSNEILLHVNLLPTSDGKQGLGYGKKLLEIAEKSAQAYTQIVNHSSLSQIQKQKLNSIIKKNKFKIKITVTAYYELQRFFPHVARLIKKLWYKFT